MLGRNFPKVSASIRFMGKIKIYTLVMLALIILCGIISVWTLYRINHLSKTTSATEQLIRETNEIHAATLENEISILSFAITFDSTFIDSIFLVRSKINNNIANLQQLIDTNEFHENRLDSIDTLIEDRLLSFRNSVETYPEHTDYLEYKRSKLANYLKFGHAIKAQVEKINAEQGIELSKGEKGLFQNLSLLSAILFLIAIIGTVASSLNLYFVSKYEKIQKQSALQLEEYQQKLEQQINQLNTSNEELEQFAYVASHDLQEPLRKITSFNDLLQDQYKDALEGDGKLYLSRISYAATRMRRLITDLLEYSRAGRYIEQAENIPLKELVDEVMDDLSLQIEQKQAKIIVDKLPEITGHYSDWRMVFQNLISNALKFSKTDQTPVINVRCDLASEELVNQTILNKRDGDKFYHIEVEDNGIGFKTDYADRIFVIFQRLHGKEVFEGTGIGLAICKKILERYGGAIFATSEVDKGSTFHLILPVEYNPLMSQQESEG